MNQYANSSAVSTLRSLSPWQPSWQAMRQHWKPIFQLGAIGIFLPLMVLEITQSWHAAEQVDELRKLTGQVPPPPVDRFLEAGIQYLGQYLVSWLICGAMLFVSFFGLLYQAGSLYRGEPDPGIGACLRAGLGQFLKRGILAILFSLIILLLVGNLAMGLLGGGGLSEILLLLFAALHLIIPVLLVQTHANPFRIVLSAVSLGYVPRIRGVKWSVFFQLITWEFMLVLTLTLMSMARNSILGLDLWLPIPREMWLQNFEGLPFGPVYLLASLTSAAMFTAILCGLAMLMTVYYCNLVEVYNRLTREEETESENESV